MLRRTIILFIALLLCLAVWWIGPLVSIGIYKPLYSVIVRSIIISFILFVALWPFISDFFSWIFRSIHASSKKSSESQTNSYDIVTSRFYDAIRTLRYVGVAKQRTIYKRLKYRFTRSYLNENPWFLVIGPSGSGKTSLIGESGERFLLSEHYGLQKTTNTGPTEECNFWLAEKSVYIDTSGEWLQLNGATEGSTKSRNKLFKLIKKYRHHPGIDGIILCLDAQWLIQASVNERKSAADALRARLLEMASSLRCELPVYLTINRIDQITGGETFLSLVSDELLQKGMGFSLNNAKEGKTPFEQYEYLYREMTFKISNYVLELLHDISDSQVKQNLLFFTESLGSLSNPLSIFLEQIFPRSLTGYSCHLRQVWFGSAAPLPHHDLYNAQFVGSYDNRQTGNIYYPELNYANIERGVFKNLSHSLSISNKIGLAGRYIIVLIFLGLCFNFLTMRYLWEKDYISYITARFNETKRIVHEIPATNHISDDLVSAYEQLGYMNSQLGGDDSPLGNPYFEHKLINDAAQKTYQRHLFQIFWPAVENYIATELKSDVSSSNHDVYNTLKVYMMMGTPNHRSAKDLVNWFMLRWGNFMPQGYTDTDKEIFSYHLRNMFSLPNEPVTKLNEELVRIARVKASDIPVHVRVIQRIEEKPLPNGIHDISLADAAGPNASLIMRRKSQATPNDMAVPGFYTRASYRDVFLPQLDDTSKEMVDEESWVLGNRRDDDLKINNVVLEQKLADEARKLYLVEYADKWDFFLHDIRARPINGLEDAAILARQLSDPSSALANLIRFTTRETTLMSNDQIGESSSWIDRQRNRFDQQKRQIIDEISGEHTRLRLTPERAVEDRFELIRRLGYQLLQTNNSSNDPLSHLFESIYNQLTTLATSLRDGQVIPPGGNLQQLQAAAARQPEPIHSIIMDLLQTGDNQTIVISQRNLNNGASSLASGLCQNSISGRYPFTRNAKSEVGIEDFSRMFSPSGAMQQFFDQNLSSHVDVNSQNWRAKPGSQGIVTPGTLNSFENARLIKDTFFTSGDKMSFSMFIRPLSLTPTITEATLDIDGQVINYSHGYAQPTRIDWPGPKGGSYVRLTFRTSNGQIQVATFDGPWALFRMFDASNPVTISSDKRELTMSMSSVVGVLNVELRSTLKDFPLWSRALKSFSCPRPM